MNIVSQNNKKSKLLEEYFKRGFSIIPVNSKKIPYIEWKEYQKRQPTADEILEWFFKFPDFNTGIITGGISHFYSIDFDNVESFKEFPDEYKNTMLTQTKRGLHLNFYSEKSFHGKILKVKNYEIEFKGTGQYVIEPFSVIDGFEYKIINPVSKIQRLPAFIEDMLYEEPKEILTSEAKKVSWVYTGKQACIKQILNRELEEGEREQSLFILYSLLRRENQEGYSKAIVIRKNKLLKHPLPEKELLHIFKEMPYNLLGCSYVRNNLTWVDCMGCNYLKEKIQFDFSKMDFIKLMHDPKLTEKDRQIAFDIYVLEETDKSKLAKLAKVSRMQVYKSIEKLKKAGYF